MPNGVAAITGPTLTEAMMVAGAALDGGSCCAVAKADMVVHTGKVGAVPVLTTITGAMSASIIYVGQTCVAYADATVTAWSSPTNGSAVGTGFMTSATTAYASWWCSNGLYTKVTGAGDNVSNASQPLFTSTNQRTELAYAACPQIAAQCGTAGKQINASTAIAASSSNNIVVTMTSVALGGPTNEDKCTWVYSCTQCAPTFTMAKNGSAGLGIVSPNW